MAANLRVGVIGGGAIAQRGHLPFYAASAHIASIAVATRSAARRVEIETGFKKIKATYDDYREMLRSEELDALSICTPNSLHAAVAIAAAQRGIHVLVEKPMAITINDAKRMIDTCRGRGVILMVNHTHRFFEGSMKVRELLERGRVGDAHTLRIRYVHGGPYPNWTDGDWFYNPQLSGGGALMDMGVHALDMGRYLFGPIRSVMASLANLRHPIPVEDTACVLAEFDGGRRGIVEVGWTGGAGFNGIEVNGARGSILMDFRKGLYLTSGGARPDAKSEIRERQIQCDPLRGGWRAAIETFINHVRRGTPPVCDGIEGLAALKAVLAAYRAARSGRRASVNA